MNPSKSQELLYTIIKEIGGIDDKIKLAKLQYFSDFIHYAFNDAPISDVSSVYEKRNYGPLARSFNSDLQFLITNKFIKQDGIYTYLPLKNENKLSEKELKTVKYVLDKYKTYSYDILYDITHKQTPYLSANDGGIVEYDTAYNLVDEYPDYPTSK